MPAAEKAGWMVDVPGFGLGRVVEIRPPSPYRAAIPVADDPFHHSRPFGIDYIRDQSPVLLRVARPCELATEPGSESGVAYFQELSTRLDGTVRLITG
jgi:hypothetical protein